jgi:spore photoproduct lyase
MPMTALDRMLDIATIYHEPNIGDYTRGVQILSRFPKAQLVEVASHQNVPGLYGNAGNVRDGVRFKRGVLVLDTKKSVTARPNDRSSDFIARPPQPQTKWAASTATIENRRTGPR